VVADFLGYVKDSFAPFDLMTTGNINVSSSMKTRVTPQICILANCDVPSLDHGFVL
jgi:hypothetical protein